MLWHIMKIYAAHGFREFVLASATRPRWSRSTSSTFTGSTATSRSTSRDGSAIFHDDACDDWRVHLVDTGLETETGGRLRRLKPWIGSAPFMLTYGDGVADVDVGKLVAFHRGHGKLATVTAVRPPSRFGGLRLDGERVAEFEEKPQIGEGWINGGFFVLSPEVLDLHSPTTGRSGSATRSSGWPPSGQLMAYRHEGFWQPMDTLRDVSLPRTAVERGDAPWKVWA